MPIIEAFIASVTLFVKSIGASTIFQSIGAGGTIYLIPKVIKKFSEGFENARDHFLVERVIKDKYFKKAIENYLAEKLSATEMDKANVEIEAGKVKYSLYPKVRYQLKYRDFSQKKRQDDTIYFWFENDYLVIYTYTTENRMKLTINNFIDEVYKERCTPHEFMIVYQTDKGVWQSELPRPYLNITEYKINLNIQNCLVLLEENFFNQKKRSENILKGRTHTYGLCLVGPGGTLKSTTPSILASKYKMRLFNILNNPECLNDESFARLISKVPPNSIICIDEFDGFWSNTTEFNDKKGLTKKGILSALDGVVKHNNILYIVTCNSLDPFKGYKDTLFRPGRLTEIVHYSKIKDE